MCRRRVARGRPNFPRFAPPTARPWPPVSGRHDPAVRRHDRILAAARSLQVVATLDEAQTRLAVGGGAHLHKQLAGHAPRDVRASVSQRVPARLEVERARRAARTACGFRTSPSPTSGTSDSRRRRRWTERRSSSTIRGRPTAPSRTFSCRGRWRRTTRFASISHGTRARRRWRDDRGGVDGRTTSRSGIRRSRSMIAAAGSRIALHARGRAVRRVRDLRRHDDRARRPGPRVDRRSRERRSGMDARFENGSGAARRTRIRRAPQTDARGGGAGGISRSCGSSRTTSITSHGARRRTIGTRAASYVRQTPAHAHFPTWDTVSVNVLYKPGDDTSWADRRALDRTCSRSSGSSPSMGRTPIRRSPTCTGSTGRHRVPDDDHGRRRRRRA